MKDDPTKPGRGVAFDFSHLDKTAGTGKLASEIARQTSLADEMLKTRGGLGHMASDRLQREMAYRAPLKDAIHRTLGESLIARLPSIYPQSSAAELAITKTHSRMAGLSESLSMGLVDQIGANRTELLARAIAEQANTARAIAGLAGPNSRTVLGDSANKGFGTSLATRYADANLASSVASLKGTYQDRYEGILREVTRIGSLGSIVVGLATQQEETLGRSSRLFDEIAGRLGARNAASTSGALRQAYEGLIPSTRLAKRSEINILVHAMREWPTIAPHEQWLDRAGDGITGLTAAWVRDDRPELSLQAMARFAHLGGVVANVDPRNAAVTDELRACLGDYRNDEASESAGEDPLLRVAEQYDRGFDPVLSSLPTKVLIAMLAPFGLRFDATAADDEFGLQDLIGQMVRRLEAGLMRYFRMRLEEAYGDTWIEHVPSEIRYQLRRRRQKDQEEGRTPSDLIAYSDWAWWTAIANHGENWRLFAPAFGSFEVLREALARLRPIRHAASHPRTVGPEDLILLAADGRWLLRCIGAVH